MKRILVALAILALVAISAGLSMVNSEYRGFPGDGILVQIPRGATTSRIGQVLADAGVVRSRYHYELVRLLHRGARVQAGEYRFAQAASASEVFDRIVKGDIYRIAITIPEGSSRFDIARILDRAGFGPEDGFLQASANPALIADLVPHAPSLEGYLFPATYHFPRQTSADQICREMTRRFRQAWKQTGADASRIHRVTTMASLIEKETGVPAERPTVSSVYWNRLDKKMHLECDPTVSYAAQLENKWRGKIHRSDLERDHPYNTYRRAGLPPGPIANPGQKSLEAALRPAETDYLFFVAKADGSGGHNFSRDLKGHQKAVSSYRDAVKKSAAE